MFSSRRLAKRSIIGTRVCAPWQDGRYYPGSIQGTETAINGDEYYTIFFDDGYTKTLNDRDIIGPGFQPITVAKLKAGQKVYLTHNGREISGRVISHNRESDEVLIHVKPSSSDEDGELFRPLEELRLMASRKSARLQDQDTDYSRLADVHSESKKRAVSSVIDVPLPAKQSRRRKTSPEPEVGILIDRASGGEMQVEGRDDEDMDTMDETMAAMVLTNLSCSPQSPNFPNHLLEKGRKSPDYASSFGSSGVFTKSEPNTPSPPNILSLASSAPASAMFGTPPIDEGIELDETSDYFADEGNSAKRRKSTRTVFKCTWPGCGKLYNTNSGIEKHVRSEHLGIKESPNSDDSSDMSDHEEEFYYTEVEVSVDTVTETFADMHTSSPPEPTHFKQLTQALPDHDYQKKIGPLSLPQNIPGHQSEVPNFNFGHQGASFPTVMPSTVSGQLSQSWTTSSAMGNQISPPIRFGKSGSAFTKGLSSSPKSSPMHKKSRSDVKKCRKVYGMENRDMWCTQCKWKKACSRFTD